MQEECGVAVDMLEPFYVTEVMPSPAHAPYSSTHFVLVHLLASPLRAEQEREVKAGDDALEAAWVDLRRVNEWTEAMQRQRDALTVGDEVTLVVPQLTTVLDRALAHYNRLFPAKPGSVT